jgi:hypothetical protein
VNLSFSRFAGSFTGFPLDAPAILDVRGTDFWLNDDEATFLAKIQATPSLQARPWWKFWG